ncbi:hypothetical protein [Macrococcus capreoli]|uniref:hypothetical protein n=1 Tax=Macrococcus capreoli TaxID=2982690 RepID=UPI003EE74EBF
MHEMEVCTATFEGIKALEDEINTALKDAEAAKVAFDDALKMANELTSFIEGSSWEGEFKNKVVDILKTATTFQNMISPAMDEHVNAIKSLKDNLSEYDNLSITSKLMEVNI